MPPSICLHMHHHRLSRSPFFVFLVFFTLFSGLAEAAVPPERPEIYPNKTELILEDGEPLNLTCRASQPVAWCSDYPFTTEEYEEVYEEDHNKPYTSILTIDKVNTSHVGYFSCVFNTTENKKKTNCNTSDPSISSLYLFVKDLKNLLVTSGMIYKTAIVGHPVVLPCKPTFPEVNVSLIKTDDTATSCKDCVYDERVGFTFTPANETQSFEDFSCQGFYKRENDSFYVVVHISKDMPLEVPMVSVEGAWQEDTREETNTNHVVYYVEENSHVNLTCTSTDKKLPSGYKLEWTNNSHLNESGTHRIIRQNSHSGSNFKSRYYEILNVQLRDSGIYSCWPKIHDVPKTAARLNLTVVAKDAAYISKTIYSPNVTEKENPVKWEVIFIAYPEPEFRWMKDGKLLGDLTDTNARDLSANYKMLWTRPEGTLVLSLHHPKLTDNGMYTVEASLPGTNISTVTTMHLMIPGKPQNVLIESINNKHMFREKEKFTLQCTAEGYPKPSISLHFTPYIHSATSSGHDEGPRVYNQIQEESVVEEEKTNSVVERKMLWMGVAEQPGWYQCKATNEHGFALSQNKSFLLTDGDSSSAISLTLLVDGEKRIGRVSREEVTVVDGDNIILTCSANKQIAKHPLTWRRDDVPLTDHDKDSWGLEVHENETDLSLLSMVRAPSLKRMASNFTLTCSDQRGNRTSLTFHVQEMKKPTWKAGVQPSGRFDKNKNENLTLSCPVDGTPTPQIVWKKGKRTLAENHRHKMTDNNQLIFPVLTSADHGKYTCEVSNRAGKISASFDVVVRDPDDQKTAIILAVVGILIMALVVLSVFFCRKIYQARKETLNLQLREQKMFIEGDPSSLNPEISLEQQAELLPYNTKYEVSRDSIIFDKLLGAGAFGRVYRATALNLLPNEARTTVAVKMMKSRTDCAQLKALRSEVKIMIHIGRHINIVNLLGACSKDLSSKGELLLVVEYCKYGNILDYMRRHRREFVNQINNEDKIDPTYCLEPRPRHRSDSSCRSQGSRGLKYAHLNFHQDNVFYGHDQASGTTTPTNLLPPARINGEAGGGSGGRSSFRARTVSASSGSHQIASDNSLVPPSETSAGTTDGYLSAQSLLGAQSPLCSKDILGWAYQIAKGMEYLAFKKVLHGDLAARNVLLAENNVVKISDFGLAKDIYKNDNYKKKSSGPVPVKWLAVECLRDGVFSTQSDVWSFGVVLWEIFSLGQVPYSCTEFDETFILKLEKGVRLEQPRYATYGLYRLMLECWSNDPMERPPFPSLQASLGEMLSEAQRQIYIQLTEPYQDDNASSEFLDLLPSQDYSNKVRETSPPLTEDGYEMPFSPGVPPQLMVHSDRQSTASRLTSRQMDYIQSVAAENSDGAYLPMSADRTDGRTVFDFDNETVACLMGRGDEKDSNGGDLYLNMDKTTPQRSPAPETPDGTTSTAREESPRRLVLKSISSLGSQGGGKHQALTKHDSGVYSPTVLSQTNPGYMTMAPLLPVDDHSNYVNDKKMTLDENRRAVANNNSVTHVKARDYLADCKNINEYANLLPQDSGRNRTLSESSSGVGSIGEDSPPRQWGSSTLKAPPILEETMVV